MKAGSLSKLQCQEIKPYREGFTEQHVVVCDTETVKGKPYSIQFYDGNRSELIYCNEKNIFDIYCDYIASHYETNLSVWFFYCQFDLPIIHYPYKDYFTYDTHEMGYGDFDFKYVSGKTWYGNHLYKRQRWVERDAFQYVFTGLEKIAKDLQFKIGKKERPSFLGERAWKNEKEQKVFEEYAIQDVLVLWELVHWILDIHREYDVGLSVSLADLCGKIFRKKFVDKSILPVSSQVSMASLYSYHGGKTEMYVKGPTYIQNIHEYDIVSAYPYAMSQIGNFFDYEIKPYEGKVERDGVYQINGATSCGFKPLYGHEFERQTKFEDIWVTGYELESAKRLACFDGSVKQGYVMKSCNETPNGLAEYTFHFFKKKLEADTEGNKSKRLVAKLGLNSLYGKFISRIQEDTNVEEIWKGGVIFHPLIATLITGFVRGYVHTIEHACNSLHTSTDAFITRCSDLDTRFPGVDGLGRLKKEYQGDVLLVRPKVYVIFDKARVHCHHKFDIVNEKDLVCDYCGAKVLKAATHGFFGSTQMLLNMWKGGINHYRVKKMLRLKEAKRLRDPDALPFVFQDKRRSLNVEWSQLTYQ